MSRKPGQPSTDEISKQAAQDFVQTETAPKPVRRYRKRLFQLYVILASLAFGLLTFYAKSLPYLNVDLKISNMVQLYRPSWLTDVLVLVTDTGNPVESIVIILGIVIFLYWVGLQWEAVMGAFSAGFVFAIDTLIKLFIHRPRPAPDLVHVFQQLHDYSYPSGHVMLFTGFFGYLLFLVFTILKPSWLRTAITIFLFALILLVGPSRVYLGEHWTSDVAGAYLLGSLSLLFIIQIYHLGKPIFFKKQPLVKERGQNQ